MTETPSTPPGSGPDDGGRAGDSDGPAPSPYNLGSVDNALRLILALTERGELRVSEAAELLGVARSTAHRLLTTLLRRGFASQEADGRPYRAGPGLIDAGLRALSRIDLRQVARPYLHELAADTGETVHLGVLAGNGLRFIDGAESALPVRVGLRVGIVLPAHATAAGKAILAALPPEEVRALYPRGVQAVTGRTLQTLHEIEQHLSDVARAGYAVNIGESADDVAALGVVVRDHTRSTIAGLAVAAPVERMPTVRIPALVSRMHRASQAISDAILTAR